MKSISALQKFVSGGGGYAQEATPFLFSGRFQRFPYQMLARLKSPLLIVYVALVGLALGSLAVATAPSLRVSPLVLFGVGVALTPHYIAFCSLLCLLLGCRGRPLVITALPLGLCIAVLALCAPLAFPLFRFPDIGSVDLFAAGLWVAFLVLVFAHLIRNAGQAPYHHDPITYIGNARYLLENCEGPLPFALEASRTQYVRTAHGLSYEAYLVFARSFLGIKPAWHLDTALHTAFQLIIPCYIMALFAAGLYFTDSLWCGMGVAILAFSPPDWRAPIYRLTREPYRMIPLTCLCLILAHSLNSAPSEHAVYIAVAAGVLTYVTIDAHAIGAYLTVMALSVYFVIGVPVSYVWGGGIECDCIFVLISCCIGGLAGGSKYVIAYRKTGQLYGSTWRRAPFKGTANWERITKYREELIAQYDSWFKRLAGSLSKSGYVLPLAGLLSACIFLLGVQGTSRRLGEMFIVCLTLFITIPGFKLLLTNVRYALHQYIFWALTFFLLVERLGQHGGVVTFGVSYVVLIVCFILTCRSSLNWYANFHYQKEFFEKYHAILRDCLALCGKNQIMLLSDPGDILFPYLASIPGYLFAKPYWPLLRAENKSEAAAFLHTIHCRFICFTQHDLQKLRLSELPFYIAIKEGGGLVLRDSKYEIWDCGKLL
ncbi:hypothetical protein LJC46_01930 [Desulfovibrio sp. OttesenSCG-928-G15]|nr:hypothetical protein [Desulfovibrio sp. OttesenSCG-928-G15]